MEITLAVHRLRKHDLTWREVGDAIVVLDLSDSSYLSVSGSGKTIWNALEKGATVDQLVDIVLEIYEVEPATARADTEKFLAGLLERKLITVTD